jgi:hypothetical protein
MTENDIRYFRLCGSRSFVRDRFLEIGSAKVQGASVNLCDLAKELGVQSTLGVDLQPGVGVDAVADFGTDRNKFLSEWDLGKFSTVAIFNVLEHTFDPITILGNALECVAPSGSLLVLVPSSWPLHNFPGDYVRLMPHWYEEFAKKFGLRIEADLFCWLSPFGITPVRSLLSNGEYCFPTYQNLGQAESPARYWISRFVHKLFNTYGRTHWATHACIGVTFTRL